MKVQTILRTPLTGASEGTGAGGPSTSAPSSAPSSTPTSTPSTPSTNPFAPSFAGRSSSTPDSQPTTEPAPAAPVQPGGQVQPTQTQTPQEPAQQQAQTQPPVAPTIQMSPEQLAQAMRQALQPQQGQQQAPMDDATFRKTFNVYEADASTYEAMFGVAPTSPAQVQALNTALQGVARQAVTIARHLANQMIQERLGQFETQIKPIQQHFQTTREEAIKTTFYTQHPRLREYEPMLREIVDAARARGQTFPSPEAAMEYVANTAYKLLPQLAGGPAVSTQNPAPGSQPAGSRAMTPMSMGGRSGQGGAAPSVNTAQRIFGR